MAFRFRPVYLMVSGLHFYKYIFLFNSLSLRVPHRYFPASVFGFVVVVNHEVGVGFGAKLRVFKKI